MKDKYGRPKRTQKRWKATSGVILPAPALAYAMLMAQKMGLLYTLAVFNQDRPYVTSKGWAWLNREINTIIKSEAPLVSSGAYATLYANVMKDVDGEWESRSLLLTELLFFPSSVLRLRAIVRKYVL